MDKGELTMASCKDCMHEYKCYLFCATETAYWNSAEDAVRAWNQPIEESESK